MKSHRRQGHRRRACLTLGALLLLAVPAGAQANAGASSAGAQATISGSLDLRQEWDFPAGLAELGYRFDSAPLLSGPAASARLGLDHGIRATASRYAPISLSSFTATGDAIPIPDSLQCSSSTCCDGLWSYPDKQSVAIADARALLETDEILLDVGHRRGEVRATLALAGAGALGSGEYVAPGVLEVTTSGCHYENGEAVLTPDGSPYFNVSQVPAVAQGGKALMRRYAVESLERTMVGVRLRGGAWQGSATVRESLTKARLSFALRGTPAAIGASCKLPSELTGSRQATVRSRSAALRLMRRAGFPHVHYGGLQHGVDERSRGRYGLFEPTAVDYLPCGDRVAVRRGAA